MFPFAAAGVLSRRGAESETRGGPSRLGPAAIRARVGCASASVPRLTPCRVESRAACTAATALHYVDVDRAAAEAPRLGVARDVHVDPVPIESNIFR